MEAMQDETQQDIESMSAFRRKPVSDESQNRKFTPTDMRERIVLTGRISRGRCRAWLWRWRVVKLDNKPLVTAFLHHDRDS